MTSQTTKQMDITIRNPEEQCEIEFRGLSSWLTLRANSIKEGRADIDATLQILSQYVGRIKANVDYSKWVSEAWRPAEPK